MSLITQRRIDLVILILLVFIMLIVGWGTYLYAFDQNPPIVFYNLPVPTDKTAYRVNEVIYVMVDYCRYTHASVTRHIRFEDDLVYYVPDTVVAGLPIGCGRAQSALVVVPTSLPPGHYRLAGMAEYRVNFLATRYVEWETTEFEIVQ